LVHAIGDEELPLLRIVRERQIPHRPMRRDDGGRTAARATVDPRVSLATIISQELAAPVEDLNPVAGRSQT
jgi:hypothetical protein